MYIKALSPKTFLSFQLFDADEGCWIRADFLHEIRCLEGHQVSQFYIQSLELVFLQPSEGINKGRKINIHARTHVRTHIKT